MSDAAERHGIGANNPPKDVFQIIDDLYVEAAAWCDGAEIETDDQAETLGALMDLLRAAGKACDAEREEKVAPLNKAKAEIQALYKPALDNVDRALKATKVARDKWLKKKQAILDEQALQARREADRVRREALEAMQASRGDIVAREVAEAVLEEAKRAEYKAVALAKATPAAVGGRKTVSKTWKAVLVNGSKAAAYCWLHHRPEMEAFIQKLVNADVKAGKRNVDGFEIREEAH